MRLDDWIEWIFTATYTGACVGIMLGCYVVIKRERNNKRRK